MAIDPEEHGGESAENDDRRGESHRRMDREQGFTGCVDGSEGRVGSPPDSGDSAGAYRREI